MTEVRLTGLLVIATFQTVHAGEMTASCPICATTWTAQAGMTGGMTAYQTDASIDCEDCKTDAASFFRTGTFTHTCKTCGPHMVCRRRQPDATSITAISAEAEAKGSVMCSTCKAVWLKTPREAGQFSTYWYASKKVCSACQSMAMEMIHTGKKAGKCAQCGDALRSRTSKVIASLLRPPPPRPVLLARDLAGTK